MSERHHCPFCLPWAWSGVRLSKTTIMANAVTISDDGTTIDSAVSTEFFECTKCKATWGEETRIVNAKCPKPMVADT